MVFWKSGPWLKKVISDSEPWLLVMTSHSHDFFRAKKSEPWLIPSYFPVCTVNTLVSPLERHETLSSRTSACRFSCFPADPDKFSPPSRHAEHTRGPRRPRQQVRIRLYPLAFFPRRVKSLMPKNEIAHMHLIWCSGHSWRFVRFFQGLGFLSQRGGLSRMARSRPLLLESYG